MEIYFRFVNSKPFDREWARLKLGDEELRKLELALIANPERGAVVQGTGGLRKLRLAIRPNEGKSGGARIGYAVFVRHGVIYLMLVFAKANQANVAPGDKAVIREALRQFEVALQKGLT